MSSCPYRTLTQYNRWSTNKLYDVVAENLGRIVETDRVLILRLLDHIHTVDEIFSRNLEGRFHGHLAPKSVELPTFEGLERAARSIGAWYIDFVEKLAPEWVDEPINFVFSDGKPARMTRGEMLLHVAAHGTYHRGNVGLLLQKNGVAPNGDRITDFLESGWSAVCRPDRTTGASWQ
jgi:uncharacterized damage-inducible protein DinB